MPDPNIAALTSSVFKTATHTLTTSLTSVLPGVADKTLVVEFLQVTNYTTVAADLTLVITRSAVDYHLAKNMTIPTGLGIQFCDKSMRITLQEGDDLKFQASAGTSLQAIISYQEIDDA